MNLIKHNFPETQYICEKTTKTQIVLHHTASGTSVNGDISWWRSNPERVATAFIIDREGIAHQLFDDEYWAYHLGLKQKVFTQARLPYKNIDKLSIGIELDSWGALLPHTDGKFYPVKWNGSKLIPNTACVPPKYFHEYCQQNRWRGFLYFEKYTTAQLETTKELLKNLCSKWSIQRTYNTDMWEVSSRALRGESGIFAHASYMYDRSDVHPQPELLNLLKTL